MIYKTGEVGFGLLKCIWNWRGVCRLSFHTLYGKVTKKYLLIYIGMAATVLAFSIFAWSPGFGLRSLYK